MGLGIFLRFLLCEPRLEELRGVEVGLYVADQLGGGNGLWFVDSWETTLVTGCGKSGDWNPTVPKTPSKTGAIAVVGFVMLPMSLRLRQSTRRPPIY